MKRNNLVMLVGTAMLLSACSTIGSWFPDKQKQYKYSTEIPPLELPPDLIATTSGIEGAQAGKGGGESAGEERRSAPAPASEEAPGSGETSRREPSNPPEPPEPPKRRASAKARSDEVSAVLGQSSDDVPLIEMEEPFDRAWNDVAKALGRLELEISDRNRSEGMYYVYYGGDGKPSEAPGFMSRLAAVFTGKESEAAREYRVKLEENGEATTVYVLDQDGKPQTEGPGFELLRRIHQTLSALAEPARSE